MRKIIITVIATFLMIAPLEKLKGQTFVAPDFPTTNIHAGVNANLSFGLWRFEPFVQLEQAFQVFEESMTLQIYPWINNLLFSREFNSSRLENIIRFNFGTKFRITDRNRVIFGLKESTFILGSHRSFDQYRELLRRWHPYFGYIRRESLSRRIDMELSVLFSPLERREFAWGTGDLILTHSILAVGAGLSYEVFNNFNLKMQLMYSRMLNVYSSDLEMFAVPNSTEFITKNLINFSIGIHYHIPIFGVPQQQTAPRPPRQRVAPHQRALPCPPGQMRHQRSWDRPSSVFNHPSGR